MFQSCPNGRYSKADQALASSPQRVSRRAGESGNRARGGARQERAITQAGRWAAVQRNPLPLSRTPTPRRMLTVDPSKRITFEQVSCHPWVLGSVKWEPSALSIYHVQVSLGRRGTRVS